MRSLPAHPASVAAFAQWQKDLGVPREKISAALSAIEALHNAASVGNPIATPIVRTATSASTIEPPRSWAKDEKQLFTELPVEIQAVVARREQDRETVLRRAQNEAGELRRLMAAAVKSADNTTTEKEIPMAKKEGHELGVGPYAKNDVVMTRKPATFDPGKDISKKVDSNADQDGGFSGKLTSGE